MIGKVVPFRGHDLQKAHAVQNVAEYVTRIAPGAHEPPEWVDALGMWSKTLRGWIAEMGALATEAVSSPQPVMHVVLSWQTGELPSQAHCRDAMLILMREFGLEGHQCIFAMHGDTQNKHLHALLNRAHPGTCKPVEVNKGFTRTALHRSVALIEHVQGWRPEPNGRFSVVDGRLEEKRGDHDVLRLTPGAKSFEERTGLASAQREAMERGAPIINHARSWQELTTELERESMRLQVRPGRGAVIHVGKVAVALSNVTRKVNLRTLEKRLGPPPGELIRDENQALIVPASEPALVLDPLKMAYHQHVLQHRESLRKKRDADRKRQREDLAALRKLHRQQLAALCGQSSNLKRTARVAIRSALRKEQIEASDCLKKQQRLAKIEARRAEQRVVSFEEWCRTYSQHHVAAVSSCTLTLTSSAVPTLPAHVQQARARPYEGADRVVEVTKTEPPYPQVKRLVSGQESCQEVSNPLEKADGPDPARLARFHARRMERK